MPPRSAHPRTDPAGSGDGQNARHRLAGPVFNGLIPWNGRLGVAGKLRCWRGSGRWPTGPVTERCLLGGTSAASMAGTSGGAGWSNAQAWLASSTCIHKPPQSWSQISLGGGWSENLYRPCQPAMQRSVPEANHEQPDTLPSTRIAVTARGVPVTAQVAPGGNRGSGPAMPVTSPTTSAPRAQSAGSWPGMVMMPCPMIVARPPTLTSVTLPCSLRAVASSRLGRSMATP